MKKNRFVVIGNGKMAIDILRVINEHADAEVVLGVGDQSQDSYQSNFESTCTAVGVPYINTKNINDPAIVKILKDAFPTYLISANNFQIFRSPTFNIAEKGIINFHNGPLPRYGGLNACSWALINGEKEHGVTWHKVDSNIDTGPILAQEKFLIDPDQDAVSLIARSIEKGVKLFSMMLPDLLNQKIQECPQDASNKSYYGLRDRPWNGLLPWWESIKVLERLSRALKFHPMTNSFYYPKIKIGNSEPLFVGEFSVEAGDFGESGTILDDDLSIAIRGGVIRILYLQDSLGREIHQSELKQFDFLSGKTLSKDF